MPKDVEVLVVGLGPVGAVAALDLARRGIEVMAVEAGGGPATDLRASTFHAPTIEILERLGATRALFTEGLKAPIYQFRDRQSGQVTAFDLGEIADCTRYPYRIQCEQHRVTEELVGLLQGEASARVAFQRRLVGFAQDEGGVTARVQGPEGTEEVRARYLIGADGANSAVRRTLGFGFPGFTYDEKFLCLSTEYPIERSFDDLAYVNYLSDPHEWLVLLRVPGLWRVLVPASEEAADAALLSDANKDAVFARILGHGAPVETRHRTIYRVHQRVCEQFVAGRAALVGDAAHLNSPMGGFGMNSGIHDAVNLGDKLFSILRSGGDPGLLGLYERQRRTVTENFVQAQTIENTRLMREGWGAARAERGESMKRLAADPVARRAYLLRQSMFTSLEQAAEIT